MEFQICTTISIFNIFSLAKIALWVKNFDPKFFYVNTCFDPIYFNIQTLPKQIKNEYRTNNIFLIILSVVSFITMLVI